MAEGLQTSVIAAFFSFLPRPSVWAPSPPPGMRRRLQTFGEGTAVRCAGVGAPC